MTGESANARCVVLCPPRSGAAQAPVELRHALAPRARTIEATDDALTAMSALVELERGFTRGEHRDPMLLLLVEPDRLGPAAAALVASVSKYAPRAAVWRFDPRAERRLAPYTADAADSVTRAPRPFSPPGPRAPRPARVEGSVLSAGGFVSWAGFPPTTAKRAPGLKYTGDEPPVSGEVKSSPTNGAATPMVSISDEELNMLLNGETGEERSTR